MTGFNRVQVISGSQKHGGEPQRISGHIARVPAAPISPTSLSWLGDHRQILGNQIMQRLLRSGVIQVKLMVNKPGYVYEQEADRVAEAVMRMPSSQTVAGAPDSGQASPSTVSPIVHEVLRSPGSPLDHETRTFMESRLGHDFSSVRIHSDARAAESARAVKALAYTVGHEVVFGAGQFHPGTTEGRTLIAHELAHVVQQSRGPRPPAISRSGDVHGHAEQQADRMAHQAISGEAVRPSLGISAPTLQLQADAGVPDYSSQLECVKRLGGCPETRPGGIPTPEEITSYNEECRQETGYTGPDVTPTAEECRQPPAPETRPSEEKETPKPEKQEPSKGASKKVCLTFDDGPQKGTEDCLNALGGTIPATFFLTGKNMASDPTTQKALVERMLKERHQIGNHTFTHDPMTTKGYEKAYGDLSDPAKLKKFQENYEKNEAHFRALLGTTSPVFTLARLPGNGRFVKVGDKLIFVVATEGLGMAHVIWHFEFGTNGSFGHLKVLDWKGIKGVAAEVKRFPNPNDIILLHDRHWSGKQTLLEEVFKKLSTNSFAFGKLDAAGNCA